MPEPRACACDDPCSAWRHVPARKGGGGGWALNDAVWNVGSGLIVGDSQGDLRPRDEITRGESAAVVLRLLQKAGLVDMRAKA